MKIQTAALSWFIKDLPKDTEIIAKSLTELAYEVEEVYPANIIEGVVLAKITECKPHPNADSLSLLKVITEEAGEETEVICGGKNVAVGQLVAWAKPGSKVGNLQLAPKELRGNVSHGMVLSISEIGGFDKSLVEDKHSKDIVVFPKATPFGTDVAELLNLHGDVIEVSILPDRQYASNIQTLARELATYNGWELVDFLDEEPSYDGETNLKLKLGENAVGISASTIKFNETEAPYMLKNILYHNGIKATGDFRDLINAIGIIRGNAAYMIEGNLIELNNNKLNSVDTLVDSLEVKQGNIVSIASKFKTNPMSIKNLEKTTGLRNARGTTEQNLEDMIKAVIKAGKMFGMIESATKPVTVIESQDKVIEVEDKDIFHFIGQEVDLVAAKAKLSKLDFKFNGNKVSIPSYRRDVEGKQDIVEEILRFVGIDNITPTAISEEEQVHKSFHKVKTDEVNRFLTSVGVSEVRTYQLLSEKEVEAYPLWNIEQRTQIRKDFGVEYNTVQTSLFKGLLEVYKHNYRQEKEGKLHFYEVQNVFHTDEDPHLHVGVIIDDEYQVENESNQTLKLKAMAKEIIGKDATFEDVENKVFNEMNSAAIKVNGELVGMMGEVHPRILRDEKFIRLDKVKAKLYYLEIDLEKLKK